MHRVVVRVIPYMSTYDETKRRTAWCKCINGIPLRDTRAHENTQRVDIKYFEVMIQKERKNQVM